jgi:GDP-L-fucose synthase
MAPQDPVFVAGHRGLVGSALVRALQARGFQNLILRTRAELDLTDGAAVTEFFRENRPKYVLLAAAKVGGILANREAPAEFIFQNLAIQTHVIHAAHTVGVEKLLFLGSSCIYPKFADQPISEDALLTGPLEPTNEPYAVAKIAGLKMCEAYARQYGMRAVCAMPTNLYGPGDNFDLATSHVLPAMIRKFYEAKLAGQESVTLWGTGTPRREFLHVDDLADACLHLMEHYEDVSPINVGTGEDIALAELAELIRRVVGFQGSIRWDHSKPDGTPRKQLDVSKLRSLGWAPKIDLVDGIRSTLNEYVNSGTRGTD